MQENSPRDNNFIGRITDILKDNLSDEHFGVSELARAAGMSRSNLLRKIKKQTGLSASVYIRQIRLEAAMQLLRESSMNVSEISYEVGFSSTSYFIKCFREYFGNPPGEAIRNDEKKTEYIKNRQFLNKTQLVLAASFLVVALVILLLIFFSPFHNGTGTSDKSIAVLPFKNDSNDSTNQYIINGLMESVLINLQKIEDLRVISRTSVEKYRYTDKMSPEIGKELEARFLVEGSGQKIGEQIMMNVQLIEANTDTHLWGEQYLRDAGDIFDLQAEVAKDIAKEIRAVITPEEKQRIEKLPTHNPVAYDYYLKGLDLFYRGNRADLEKAAENFGHAIHHDPDFALAYADLAISYYFLDIARSEKEYTQELNDNAEKALELDQQLPQSLIAKALSYLQIGEKDQAVLYLEKAHEFNPNSALVINILSDFYTSYIPNTAKYLEYALKGVRLDIASHDSVTASFIYLHLSNALIQTGFVKEAEKSINRALDFNPGNIYADYVRAYILYARNRDLGETKHLLEETLKKDPSRLDVLQETAKICYFMRDYDSAYIYYKRFIDITEEQSLTIYRQEYMKISVVLSKMGKEEKAKEYLTGFKEYADQDESIYHNLNLAIYYSWKDEQEKSIQLMKEFLKEENYHYWILLFLDIDPAADPIRGHPEYRKVLKEIEAKFWDTHNQIKDELESKSLI